MGIFRDLSTITHSSATTLAELSEYAQEAVTFSRKESRIENLVSLTKVQLQGVAELVALGMSEQDARKLLDI